MNVPIPVLAGLDELDRKQDELRKLAPWWCGCGNPDTAVLKEILSCYTGEYGNLETGYIDLKKMKVLNERYGDGWITLILYLLEYAGVIGHYGSINSSSFLTVEGERILEWLNR